MLKLVRGYETASVLIELGDCSLTLANVIGLQLLLQANQNQGQRSLAVL